jgi:hypothetical protein
MNLPSIFSWIPVNFYHIPLFYRYSPLKSKYFIFQGKKLPYFYHDYNTTGLNERTIEVPIIMEYLKSYSDKRILEVGAVLPHYYPTSWDVIDKFEKGTGVINHDIIDFKPSEKYDLIVSISTLEHVGFDDAPKDKGGLLKSIDNLKNNCLAPGGMIVMTLPLGYNQDMDYLIFENKVKFNELFCLERFSQDNRWGETNLIHLRSAKYGVPYKFANALIIGVINSSPG